MLTLLLPPQNYDIVHCVFKLEGSEEQGAFFLAFLVNIPWTSLDILSTVYEFGGENGKRPWDSSPASVMECVIPVWPGSLVKWAV